ncbi:MAG: hypothetical protein J6R61_01875, partial [Bacteroidales bacterium]|nr:hypothetical protein [Bacteroidales bacterium]
INFAASTTDDFHYTVTYMPNGGEGEAVVDTVLYGFPYGFRPCNLFEKDGYLSFEWNLKADGTGINYLTTDTLPMLTRNIVVYPKRYATSGELDADGYEYVDLCLTSGTKWATWNYGATAVGKIGSYVTGGDQASMSKRPTQAQAQELIDECDWLLRSDAYIVKSKINNNGLILPLSGYQREVVVSGSLRWVTKGVGLSGYYWTKDSFSNQGFTYFYALGFNFNVRKLYSDYSYKYNVRYVKK